VKGWLILLQGGRTGLTLLQHVSDLPPRMAELRRHLPNAHLILMRYSDRAWQPGLAGRCVNMG
jgi:hypothetical protein